MMKTLFLESLGYIRKEFIFGLIDFTWKMFWLFQLF
jgi:hypothetical protein